MVNKLIVSWVMLLGMVSCACDGTHVVVERGWVRSFGSNWAGYNLAWERESPKGETVAMHFNERPPVWQGEHVELVLEANCDGEYVRVVKARRLD